MKAPIPEPEALRMFKTLADMPELMALAVHTTDFKGVCVECALVNAEETPVYSFRCAITPGYEMQPGATAFHGITAEDVAGALPASFILRSIWQIGGLGKFLNPEKPPFVVAYDPRFVADSAGRTLKGYLPGNAEADQMRGWFTEFGADERRDVKELYSYLSGIPSARKAGGPLKSPFSWVSLPQALKQRGVPVDDLDNSAISQARRVIRLVKAAAALNPEDLPHLLEAVDSPAPREIPRLTVGLPHGTLRTVAPC